MGLSARVLPVSRRIIIIGYDDWPLDMFNDDVMF